MGFAAGFAAGTAKKKLELDQQQFKTDAELRRQQMLLQRQQLDQTRQQMDLELVKAGYVRDDSGKLVASPGGAAEAEGEKFKLLMQEYQMQQEALRSLTGRLAAEATDAALTDFAEHGDANIFQRTLNNDPFLRQAWEARGVRTIANIDIENDVDLLRGAGIDVSKLSDPAAVDALRKSVWKYHDGTEWHIGSVAQLAAETGYMRRASTTRINTLSGVIGRLRSAFGGTNVELKDREADTAAQQTSINAVNADTARIGTLANVDLGRRQHALNEAELEYKYRKLAVDAATGRGSTSKQKDLIASNREVDLLLEAFGGADAFFNTDFNDQDAYRKAYPHIAALEKLEGTQLSDSEKKDLNSIRQLIAMADPAKQLSVDDTGFIDNFFNTFNKYLADNVGGVQAKSAYAAFRNTVRHALFGSALTEAELKSFNEAFGTLGQKLGPVLEQFKVNLVQVKAKLESMARNNNPYVMHVRVGVDDKRLDRIISALDQRIAYIAGKNSAGVDPALTSPVKPTLEELYKATQGK